MKQGIIFSILFYYSILSFSQNYPSGFSQITVSSGISFPTVFDFAPDGRFFIAQQDGALRVIKNGVLLPTPAIDLNVDMNGERGLVGIAVHPNFSNNRHVYLFYTLASGTKRNRISRFTFNGDIIDPSSETIILELDPLNNSNIHNGGCMKFSQDGKLIISVGENNISANAQNLDTYHGKILRINPDGTVPEDNPYATGSTPQRQRVWAMGLRNPFTFDIHPTNGKIFVNEVGHALCEEINDATLPGVNFGWPTDQCKVQGTSFNNPVFHYYHSGDSVTGCAITGGTFFSPSVTNYPQAYNGKYFFVDYCSNWIRFIDPNLSDPTSNLFAISIPANSLSLKTGPDGNMYFLSRSTGALYKIVYNQNTSPLITNQPDPVRLAISQKASFSVSVSGAPPFTFQWKKNGVNIPGATSSEYIINHVAMTDSGKYSVLVSNASGNVLSQEVQLTVVATVPPVGTILSPSLGTLYKAGNMIHFSGTGNDPEDGILPASAFSWKVEFWHGTGTHKHVHDGPPIAEGIKTGSFIIPTNNETATDVFYRLILKVKDAQNIFQESYIDIFPELSTVTLATEPPGFQVLLDGQARNTPFTFEGVEGIERTLGVVTPQVKNSVTYKFDKWQHGGNSSQVIQTPENDLTYTALFVEDTDLRDPENPSSVAAGLNYEYYEGTWLVLPDYNTLNPVKTGTVPAFNLSPAEQSDHYAFRYTGYIDILQNGVYKFYTNSNDGSKLYIGNRLVVNNDGVHANMEIASTIGLKKGKHSITVTYFEYTGSNNLVVSYSSDFLSKREIPASQLFHSTGTNTNIPPAVSITKPVNYQQYPDHTDILIEVSATDVDGTINKVEFFESGVKIGEDSSAPFEYLWQHIHEGSYTFTAKAFDDTNDHSISAPVTVHVGEETELCSAEGMISREYWTGIGGTSVSDIPPGSDPNGSDQLTLLEAPQNWGNNYGTRIRGYICPPATGNYYFWIASNDQGELWLSTDENPANKIRIALVPTFSNYRQWDKFPEQKSTAISLHAGKKYYIEALQKEGVNSDHLSVGWELPDGTYERPIPGSRLSSYGSITQTNLLPQVQITEPENNELFLPDTAITITASASDPDGTISKVEFYQSDVKLGEDLSAPYAYNWTNVPQGNYTLIARTYDNQGASAVSSPVSITVKDSSDSSEQCQATGSITREYWTGVQGTSVAEIPIHIPPSGTDQLTELEAPQNWTNHYGTRIRGYICPPSTGEYIFWISSNDQGELWLSTDENVANKEKICFVSSYTNYRQWDKFSTQQSTPILLEAGKQYYIEALQKEGVNSDHLSVGWLLPDGTLERPISGSRLSPYLDTIDFSQKVQSIALFSAERSDITHTITAFPNPTETGIITLAIEGYRGKTKASIRIADLNGKEMYAEKISCDVTCPRTLVNLHEKFSPGTYIINVEIDDQLYSEKLIIR